MTKKPLLPWLVFLCTLGLYLYSLAPTVMWGDSADLALKVHDFILDPAADGHPSFVVLGYLFNIFLPWELAINLNFMCAVFAALTVLFVYLIIRNITGNTLAAIAGAVSLAVSHSFWAYAVITEVYTLNTFFLAFLIWLLLIWREDPQDTSWLYWGAFAFGLALTNHMLLGLFGVAVLFIMATYQPKIFLEGKKIGLMLLLFVIGASLYWGTLLYWTVTLPPAEVETIADIVTGREEHRSSLLAFSAVGKNIFLYFAYLFYQFPLWGFVLGFFGFHSLYKKDKRLFGFIFLALFANAFFTLAGVGTYGNANYTFYISDYVVFSIAIGYGVDRLLALIRRSPATNPPQEESTKRFSVDKLIIILLCITPILMYNLTPMLVRKFNIDLIFGRSLPYRDNNVYFLNPNKHGYRGPELYAELALKRTEPDKSIIIADFTPGVVLEYFTRIKKVRPDVKVIYTSDAGTPPDDDLFPYVDKNIADHSIYLANNRDSYYNIVNVLKKYDLVEAKPIWKLQPKKNPLD